MTIELRIVDRIDRFDPQRWDGMVRGNYPFLRHAFLSAMERHGSVGEASGWIPSHLGCFEDGNLVGAMPLYQKHNSWGEFVFDHAWADAFHRAGIDYYPKLVNAIPFTPATGQRLLAVDGREDEIVRLLLQGARKLLRQHGLSGLHTLFPGDADYDRLRTDDAVTRVDCQFHWHNRGYGCFDDFLATLKSRKRKKIRQERQRARATDIDIRRLDGDEASERDWAEFTALYRAIYQRKFGAPAFSRGFFMEVAAAMPGQVRLVLARRGGQPLAAALMYLDDHTLYGRHWGSSQRLDCLHFELCYYQGIEICIEQGLERFDPGAQGEHKIARGFMPTRTRSLHWMAHSPFTHAIRQFAGDEESGVASYIAAAREQSPYHHADGA